MATTTKPRPTQKDHCAECGALCKGPEFHPYVFCVLKKAGLDPWRNFKDVAEMLGIEGLPAKSPRLDQLPLQGARKKRAG